jgi:23S rRNA pseudouridine1911/1915/1917 synthase
VSAHDQNTSNRVESMDQNISNIAQRIVYEDNHLLILNKLPGELVQGDKTGDPSLIDHLKEFIKQRDHKPGNVFLGLVNRIDRPTSGLVVFTKTSKGLSRLTESFRTRDVKKYYLVLTQIPEGGIDILGKKPYQGEFRDQLWKHEKTNTSKVVKPGDRNSNQAKEAVLSYRLVQTLDRYLLWLVNLQTGRHHQIRVQFGSRGMAVRGDVKYGARRGIGDGSIGLHSWCLELPHPTKPNERVITQADPRVVQADRIWQQVDVSALSSMIIDQPWELP